MMEAEGTNCFSDIDKWPVSLDWRHVNLSTKPSIEIETCETTNQEKKSLEVNAVYNHFQIWLLQLHYQKMLLSKQVIIFSLSLSDCQLDDELGWIFVWDCVIPMFPLFHSISVPMN